MASRASSAPAAASASSLHGAAVTAKRPAREDAARNASSNGPSAEPQVEVEAGRPCRPCRSGRGCPYPCRTRRPRL
eukprot:3444409-Pyramimonas_sp.AAC.1